MSPAKANIFGQRIKQRLKELDKTQVWLDEHTGIPKQTISNIINGRFENSGSIVQAVPIAKAMNTTVDYMFGLTTQSAKPIWPSNKVRRLAAMAELLPDAELDRLLSDVSRRVESSRQELWQADLVAAVGELVQRHGGDVEAALRQLDKLANESEERPKPSESSPSQPLGLFDECKK